MEAIYRQGTTKEQILFDGWSRGLSISQVVSEVKAQGFQTNDEIKEIGFRDAVQALVTDTMAWDAW